MTRGDAVQLWRKVASGATLTTGRTLEAFANAVELQCPTTNKLLSAREQIQEDLMTILDGESQEMLDAICDVVVKNFKPLFANLPNALKENNGAGENG